ncbi:hypothetical protein G210_3380 [Candida maltosa Xu316]|uniref:Uncharacterized protein n=1 Tax=Candida maltosa (strain Xu316) TaxID=1245528 RepID=M3JU28_CANMX|nr:hypothetical protein G210_3380 [Candida maltosa Xu316]
MNINLLTQLPDELIQLIFNYLPNEYLKGIQDIPRLQNYVLISLYSSVDVLCSTCRFKDPPIVILDPEQNDRPEFDDYHELKDFLEENNLGVPQVINFHDPIDILLCYKSYPNLLQNDIHTTFLHFSRDWDRNSLAYIIAIKNLPINIVQIDWFQALDETKFGSNNELLTKLTSLGFGFHSELEPSSFFRRYDFTKLTDLQILPRILYDDVKFIPRTIKKLTCAINARGLGSLITVSQHLQFPPKLVKLEMTLLHDMPNYRLEIQQLTSLEHLIFHSGNCSDIAFPEKLLKLKVTSRLNMYRLKSLCPDLCSLDTVDVIHDESLGYPEFPSKLKALKTDATILQTMAKSTVDPSYVAFPQTLEDIFIAGKYGDITLSESKTKLLHSSLTNLKKLGWSETIQSIGVVPEQVQSLAIDDSRFDINLLSGLQCLRKLSLTQFTSVKFDIKLPNLEDLTIVGNGIFTISGSTFIFPSRLKKLSIQNFRFSELDDGLEKLKDLKELVLESGHFDKPPKFPLGLNVLELKDNKIRSFSSLNLQKLGKLERLDLSRNLDRCPFDINNLPKSITHLYLEGLGLKEINGSFRGLPKLKEISLHSNNLAEYFNTSRHGTGDFFGSEIKHVILDDNSLKVEDVRVIFHELRQKPKFRNLMINRLSIPPDLPETDYIYFLPIGL